MFMRGFPALICALLASAVLLRRRPLLALALTLAGLAVTSLAPKTDVPASALQVVVVCAAGLEVCYLAAARARAVSVTGAVMAGAGLPVLILELPSTNPPLPPNGTSGLPVPLVTIAVPLVIIIAWLIGQAQARAELVRAQAGAGPVTIQVILADDQPLHRAGLRRLIEQTPGIDVAGEAGTGAVAVQLARDTGAT